MEKSYLEAIQEYEKSKPFYQKPYFSSIINAVVIIVFAVIGWSITIQQAIESATVVAKNQKRILEILNGNGRVGLVGKCEQNKIELQRLRSLINIINEELRNL